MLESQKWELKKVELRAAIAAFPDDGNSDDLQKLNAEYRDADTRYASAIIVESADAAAARAAGDLNAEQREVDAIAPNLNFRRYVAAAAELRSVDGAEAEWNAAHGMSGRQFPLAMLAPVATRATTDVNGQANQRRWLDRLFAESAATRIGITSESVPAGQANYMTTTAGATGAQRGKRQAAADAPWTVGVKTLEPKRGAVHGKYAIQDAARLPGLADALRRDFRGALMDSVDLAIFLGDDTANPNDGDIVGLTTYPSLTEETLTQAAKIMASEVLGAFSNLVDGVYATDLQDLRVVTSVGAYREWTQTIVASTVSNETLAQFLTRSRLAWSARGGIDDDTGDNSFGAFIGRSRGIEGAGVTAIWDAGQMIVDEVTEADEGNVKLTMNYLWAFDLPRHQNFARLKFVA